MTSVRLPPLCCWLVFSGSDALPVVRRSENCKLVLTFETEAKSLGDSRALSLRGRVVNASKCGSGLRCGFSTYKARRELAYTVKSW